MLSKLGVILMTQLPKCWAYGDVPARVTSQTSLFHYYHNLTSAPTSTYLRFLTAPIAFCAAI